MKEDNDIDDLGITTIATANYLDRQIILINMDMEGEIENITPSKQSLEKPPLWIACKENTKAESTDCDSLICHSPTTYNKYTSYHTVEGEQRSLTKEEMATQIRKLTQARTKDPKIKKYKAKVISYFSKVIAKEDRSRAIHELEAQALISALHNFKSYISMAPVVLTCIDSRTAFFLFSPGVYRSALKVRRWNLLLASEYPQVILQLIQSKQNWSDLLSRTFDIPPKVLQQFDINKELPEIPAYDDTICTYEEAEKMATEFQEQENTVTTQSITLDTINQFTEPLRILRERLGREKIIEAQKILRTTVINGNQDEVHMHDGMVVYGKENLPYIPKKLEGIATAYCHLVTGHAGSQKLIDHARSMMYFPQMYTKLHDFARMCQSCLITNKLTGRKGPLGETPMPTFAFETVFADLIESLPPNQLKFRHLLVITDYLSKNVYCYPLKSKKASGVTEALKLFLMHTNMTTKNIITDNGACFRDKKFVTFVTALGILLPKTAANSSKSRGAVEIQNKLLTILISKLLILSPKYNYHDVHFLAALLLNNTYHHATKTTPAEIIFGGRTINNGPFGLNLSEPPLTSRLLSASLQEQVKELSRVIRERVDIAAAEVAKTREEQHKYANKGAAKNKSYKEGDIIFVKNYTLPPPGGNIKFRPNLHKSPFVVTDESDRAVTCMRIVDGWTVQIHKDHIRPYKKRSEIFKDLPIEVQKIVGGTFDLKDLKNLAKTDDLALIYYDTALPLPKPARTRSKTAAERNENNEGSNDEDDSAS